MKRYHLFIFSLLISFCVNLNIVSSLYASKNFPEVEYTPTKSVSYGGSAHKSGIKGVRVSPCLSLGGGCIDKIDHILKNADQFIVSFMYRFNSPTLIRTMEDQYIKSPNVVVFLDYNQVYENSFEDSQYHNYVKRLIDSVPTSIVKLGNRNFHQKVIISKKAGDEAITMLGSANATFEADNMHSEDLVFVQSNELAAFYLDAFTNLFRSEPQNNNSVEQQVKVFHEHRVKKGSSNIDFIDSLKNNLTSPQNVNEKLNDKWYKGDIVSLAISTGHPESEGTKKCSDVISDVLGAKNKRLFLFENYISLSDDLKKGSIWKNLVNATPKFIVLDDNKTNREELKKNTLNKNDEDSTLLFKPFTGKKFHHKLIIQFPDKSAPAVYTGSFHISTSAIQRNSETIIGIQSQELADEYLSSLLLNSGLGDDSGIWKFIQNDPGILRIAASRKLSFENKGSEKDVKVTKVLQAAKQLFIKSQINIDRYSDRLDRIRTEILGAASNNEDQLTISKYFDTHMDTFNTASDVGVKLTAIEKLKEAIFNNEGICKIWLKYLNELRKNISSQHTDVEKLPEYNVNDLEPWLNNMHQWIEDETREYKINGYKIKKYMHSIEHLYRALNDLNEYETTFSKYSELHDILGNITNNENK